MTKKDDERFKQIEIKLANFDNIYIDQEKRIIRQERLLAGFANEVFKIEERLKKFEKVYFNRDEKMKKHIGGMGALVKDIHTKIEKAMETNK